MTKDAAEHHRTADSSRSHRQETDSAVRWHRAHQSSDTRAAREVGRTSEQAAARKATADKSAGHRVTDRRPPRHSGAAAETPEERRARGDLLRKTDAHVLGELRTRFGAHIQPERLAEANRIHTKLQTHDDYQRGLREAYPRMSPERRAAILGDVRCGIRPHVDAQDYRVRTTLAHEHLHQLTHPRFSAQFGQRLTEGLTERYAREISRPIPIKGAGECYPREGRILDLLHAQVHADSFKRAYFQGDTARLRQEIDARFGTHAADRVAAFTELGKKYSFAYDAAEAVLKQGDERQRRKETQ